MYYKCKPIDDTFFETAPLRWVNSIELDASAEDVFELFSDENEWPRWYSDMKKVTWHTPHPFKVGTMRNVTFKAQWGYLSIDEYFYRWDDKRRFSFYLTGMNMPLCKSLAEDYELIPISENRCKFVYRVAIDPKPMLRLSGLLGLGMLGGMFVRATTGLARFIDERNQMNSLPSSETESNADDACSASYASSQPLLTPVKLGPYELKNRVVMAPMTRVRASLDRNITSDMVEYYRQRASAGLIITEGTIVSPDGAGYIRTPGIYTPRQIRGWKEVTDAVHERGGRIFVQLWHCGSVSHPLYHGGFPPRGVSPINPNTETFTAEGFKASVVPREMTTEDIKEIVDSYRRAAANAMEAGFDGVKIHGSNGYLFDQFLRSGSNQRTDEYGGSVENRARFLFEVLDAVTKEIGVERTALRLSPSGLVQVLPEPDTRGTYGYVIERLNKEYPNLAFLELLESVNFLGDDWETREGDDPNMIQNVTEHYRNVWKGTLITNNGYNQETGNKAIADGTADLVSYGALYIANPDLVERFDQNGPFNEVDKEHMYMGEEVGYTNYPTLGS